MLVFILCHWPALWLSSPLQPAAASARPALPSLAAAPPPAGSTHSDSPSSGRSACGLSNTKRRRGSDSGRIWGFGSSCVVSAAAAQTGPLYFLLRLQGSSRAFRCIRQDLSYQQRLLIFVRQLLLLSVAAGLLPAERTSITKSPRITPNTVQTFTQRISWLLTHDPTQKNKVVGIVICYCQIWVKLNSLFVNEAGKVRRWCCFTHASQSEKWLQHWTRALEQIPLIFKNQGPSVKNKNRHF